jgi:hypothetical protein
MKFVGEDKSSTHHHHHYLHFVSRYYKVLPALKQDVPTPQLRGSYVKTHAVDCVKYTPLPEDCAHTLAKRAFSHHLHFRV